MRRFTAEDLERLLHRHAKDIEVIVRRAAPEQMDRDDLRQEIAIALWQAMPKFAGDASERTYVLRVAQNRALTFRLRLTRNHALFGPLEFEPLLPSHSGELEIEWLSARIARATAHLPAHQRDALTLAAEGLSPRQIALHTGRSAGAVRVALHRARETVRRWLNGDRG